MTGFVRVGEGNERRYVHVQEALDDLYLRVGLVQSACNELADAVMAVQRTLGINPHGEHDTVADRIASLEGNTGE